LKRALYTVYLGGYDHEPRPYRFIGWENVIISDQPIDESGWDKVIYVKPTDKPDVESRRYKWLSHIYLSEYNMVCYYDANMKIFRSPPTHPFRIKHWKRSNVKQEVEACNRQVHRCTPESLNQEYDFFVKEGFPDNVGLFLNGFFCREHNKIENTLCEYIFDIVQKYTPRDQVAMPYVVWKLNYKAPQLFDAHFYFRYIKNIEHKITKPKIHGAKEGEIVLPVVKPQEINVHHITPGRSDKNLGKAINDLIKALPDQDWICLRDIDTIPMYHEVFFEQCEKIAKENKFDLIGCMTNRLGFNYQLYNGIKSNESDILKHREIAKELYFKHGSNVKEIKHTIGGLFMLFSKKTWQTLGGFPEGAIFIKNSFIDYHFASAALKKRLKIGIAEGIYLFHYYRLDYGDNTRDAEAKEHLMTEEQKIILNENKRRNTRKSFTSYKRIK
jgi:hypothetical protein